MNPFFSSPPPTPVDLIVLIVSALIALESLPPCDNRLLSVNGLHTVPQLASWLYFNIY